MNKDLRLNAEKAAREQGFSSLQEIVRVFLSRLAANKVEVTVESIFLSEQNEKRYLAMTEDFEKNKNVQIVHSVADLLTQLNED
jgi:antitoxin component of RelBE/YafQ-DinJ toxin-antitoxin module